MALKLYNSLAKEKQLFESIEPGKVRMYCCGPTVYDFLHIGNFRGAVVYNLLRNWLEKSGYEVQMAYNFTDVDDKIIKRANEENTTSEAIAAKYIAEFQKDYESLGLRKHSFNPKATDHIGDMIQMIEDLISADSAYEVEGEVFYSIQAFSDYGKLSGRNVDELQAGVRVEVDPKKRNPMDFTLWKPSKEGEPSWDSPWGKGRPGWHIECSAMIKSVLGGNIDIHGGGMDLIFPHHENEIAQYEACHNHPYVKYWVHNNMLNFDGQKMSKSLGNLRSLRSFVEKYNGEIFKFLMLSAHYRSVLNFSDTSIHQAVSGLARIYSAMAVADSYSTQDEDEVNLADASMREAIDKASLAIHEALDDDLGTPEVMAEIFQIVRLYNQTHKRGQKASSKVLANSRLFREFLRQIGDLMSLFQHKPSEFLLELDNMLLRQKGLQRAEIDRLIEDRSSARKEKDFAKSDEIRDQLTEMGISIQDLPAGTHWEVAK